MSLATDIDATGSQDHSPAFIRRIWRERNVDAVVEVLPQILVPVIALGASWAIHSTLDGAPRAARMVPDIICVAVAIIAVAQLLATGISLLRRTQPLLHGDDIQAEDRSDLASLARQVAVLVLMIAFVPAVQNYGFLIPSLAFIALVGFLSGDKARSAVIVSSATVATVFGVMSAAGFYYPLW